MKGARLALLLGAATSIATAVGHADDGAGAARRFRAGPASWPGTFGISRVRVDVRGQRALVTTDVLLSADAARAPALHAFVAYGVPGPPLALDAELVAVPAARLSAPAGARGKRVALHAATHAPDDTTLLLGPANMAGSTTTIPADMLRAALAASGSATLRLRAIEPLSATDADGAHQLLLRLGAQEGAPLILGAVEIDGATLTDRKAWLCGPHADPSPLAVLPRRSDAPFALAPPLAARAPDDALCVGFRSDQKESEGDGVRPVDSR